MTTAEYLDTPETVLPRELAHGVLRVAEAPSTSHQRVVRDLAFALSVFVSDRGLGEILFAPLDVILDFSANLVVQPDIVFVSRQRGSLLGDRLHGAPDLVVEVLSPNLRIGQLDEKVGWFARYGVRECWLANVRTREVTVLTLGPFGVIKRAVHAGMTPVESDVLAGVGVTPLAIFGY